MVRLRHVNSDFLPDPSSVMNASFLLAFAAHRFDQCTRGDTLPVTARTSPSSAPSPDARTSDTCVVSIPALHATMHQHADVLIPEDPHSGQLSLPAAGSALREPPAAARPQRAQAGQAATEPGNLSTLSISSSSSSCVSQECRICLAADSAEGLIKPCSCCGTLAYTHMSCLKTWVEEKGSLMCELCGQRYRQPFVQVLEPVAAAALQRHKQGRSISAAPLSRHISRGEWCSMLLSLFLLMLTFFIVSMAMSKEKG